MFDTICEILLNYIEEPEGGLRPETTFIEDLAMSSLEIMTMVGDLEDKLGVSLELSEMRDLRSIGELAAYLTAEKAKNG